MRSARPLPSVAPVLVTVLALVLLAAPALAQDFDRYEVKTEPLADGLFLLTGAGGKVLARTGDSGLLLVDTDYGEMHDKLQAALTALEAGPVRLAIDTHWHFDHVGGNEGFARDGAVIAAHESVRGWMAADQRLPLLDTDVPASPPAALPVLSCGDRLLLHWGGEEIAVVHAPRAHTGGDLLVHFRGADVIHAGDVVFSGGYPYIDTGHGGSIDGMIAGVETILGMCGEGTRIVPGHGPLLTPAEVRGYLEMLRAFRAAIAADMAAGRSLEAILAEPPTAELDAEWGQRMFPPDLFTRMVHRSLAAE